MRLKFFGSQATFVLNALTLLSTNVFMASSSDPRYPQDALQCYSTSSVNKKIICPEDRNHFCLKEVISSSRRECGESQEYPLDYWDIREPGGLCVYKKCSNTCPNTTATFNNNEIENSRYSLCCTDSLCNSAAKIAIGGWIFISLVGMILVT